MLMPRINTLVLLFLRVTDPLHFFSRKLTETQQRYSVTEIELLVIVETLKEFKGMFWGQRMRVNMDHKHSIKMPSD